jgi:hypothetical protein
LKADSVDVTSVKGVDNPEATLAIAYTLHCADYAEVTKNRLIFRPSVFHGLTPAPFSASTRHSNIIFPYRWTEEDRFNVRIPAGYELESADAPPSQPGDAFNYVTSIEYVRAQNNLAVTRSFSCNEEEFTVEAYPSIKTWFDSVAVSDAHQLILKRSDDGATQSMPKGVPPGTGTQ